MMAEAELGAVVGTAPACGVMGLPRASHCRHLFPAATPSPFPPRPSPRALSLEERNQALAFADLPPREVFVTLLDAGTHLCLIRAMDRLWAAVEKVGERRDQLRIPRTPNPAN